jgi:SAM-dependent methyltransferase
VAGHVVTFAAVSPGERVLDVGTGTGVVALTAARLGARVTALDLTPELLAQARENAKIAGLDAITWSEGDAESLPYPDASFDVVLSQFGHLFAPRPEVAVAEMRRVLKPGGRVVFATWPPEHLVGRIFAFVGRHSPPPPPGAAPPPQWGNPTLVAERLGERFEPPFFERGMMHFPALSLPHSTGCSWSTRSDRCRSLSRPTPATLRSWPRCAPSSRLWPRRISTAMSCTSTTC